MKTIASIFLIILFSWVFGNYYFGKPRDEFIMKVIAAICGFALLSIIGFTFLSIILIFST